MKDGQLNLNSIFKDYKFLFLYAKRYSKKFYRTYRNIFNINSLDLYDIIQESYLSTLKFMLNIRKGKFHPKIPSDIDFNTISFKKIVGNNLFYTLSHLREKSFNYNKVFTDIKEQDDFSKEEKLEYLFSLSCPENHQNILFLIEELQSIFSQKEFEIIKKKFCNGMTFEELGQLYNIPKHNIKYQLKKILEKLRNKMLSLPKIDKNKCKKCGECMDFCEKGAIINFVITEECNKCNRCIDICSFRAIQKSSINFF